MSIVLKKIFTLVLIGFFLISSAEASWITKKTEKSKEEIKEEKKQKNNWIKFNKQKNKIKKKEILKNKEEFKKEEKKITNEVKSWITKKTKKKKYVEDIKNLPDGAIYFTGSNNDKSLLFYGYVIPDSDSELIDGFYKTSKGTGFFNDGKTICQIGSTVLLVDLNELTARVSGECSNGLKFTGKTTQTKNAGWGSAKTNDGTQTLNFDFNIDKNKIAKIFNKNLETKTLVHLPVPSAPEKVTKDTDIKPTGKYYALLIGNSNYVNWSSLKSPINDITKIGNILKQKYKFEKVITIKNANRKEIFNGFNAIKKLSTDNDYVLIYYAGHGMIVTNQSYWIPVDGEKETGSGDWININDIANYLKPNSPNEILARHLVLMADSCYFAVQRKGNQFQQNKIQSYKKLLMRKARIIVASGSNEPVEDTNEEHSIFGMGFIEALQNNEDIIKMNNIIENIIVAHSGMSQQPNPSFYPGHGGGDFLFVAKK